MLTTSPAGAAPRWPDGLDQLPVPVPTALALVVAAALAALTLGAFLAGRRSSRRGASTELAELAGEHSKVESPTVQRRWRAVEMVLTLAAAGIATATAVTGMWRVFTDAWG